MMKVKTTVLKKFSVATLVCSLFAGVGGVPKVMAEQRNKRYSPPKADLRLRSQNPLVDVQQQIKTLNTSVNSLTSRLNTLDANVDALSGSVDTLEAKVDAIEAAAPQANLLWVSHLDARPREAHGLVTTNGTPIGATSGLVIRPTTTGVDRVLEQGLQVPPGFAIKKVALCYQVSNPASYITHIKLTRLTGADSYSEVLNDLDDKTSTSATCVESMEASAPVDPSQGPVRLNLGVTFTNATHLIMIRAIGLYLEPLGF